MRGPKHREFLDPAKARLSLSQLPDDPAAPGKSTTRPAALPDIARRRLTCPFELHLARSKDHAESKRRNQQPARHANAGKRNPEELDDCPPRKQKRN